MVASCIICLGQSGKQLAGKRCTASRCKAEYAARIKLAKAAAGGGSSAATSPTASAGAARSSAELELLVSLKLWELFGIYGRREYDPDSLTAYELRNGISADREKELAYLIYAEWKEDANDIGRATISWVTLEDIVTSLSDNELNVLDHYEENHPSKEWTEARAALRELHPCDDDE
jgi:hypothetical protein